jgi:hypothetical protein
MKTLTPKRGRHDKEREVNLNQIKSIAIYVMGLASVVIGAIPQTGLPAAVHAALVSVGGVIVAIERYLQGSTALKKAGK